MRLGRISLVWLAVFFSFIVPALGQQAPPLTEKAYRVNFYPLSVLRRELRFGYEKQTDTLRSLEFGASYFYGVRDRVEECNDCRLSIMFPGYRGRGLGLMLSRTHYNDDYYGALTGRFFRYSAFFNTLKVTDNRAGQEKTFQKLTQLGAQFVYGRQFREGTLSGGIFWGLSGYYYMGTVMSPNPSEHNARKSSLGLQLLLGVSVGKGSPVVIP